MSMGLGYLLALALALALALTFHSIVIVVVQSLHLCTASGLPLFLPLSQPTHLWTAGAAIRKSLSNWKGVERSITIPQLTCAAHPARGARLGQLWRPDPRARVNRTESKLVLRSTHIQVPNQSPVHGSVIMGCCGARQRFL